MDRGGAAAEARIGPVASALADIEEELRVVCERIFPIWIGPKICSKARRMPPP
jgi:hypothetical protein